MLEHFSTLHNPDDGCLKVHVAIRVDCGVRLLDLLRRLALDRATDAELRPLVRVFQVQTDQRRGSHFLKCRLNET
jgi:hypothetical protein